MVDRQVRLSAAAEALVGVRYPRRLVAGDQSLGLVDAGAGLPDDAAELVAHVVDGTDRPPSDGRPVLIGVDALARHLQRGSDADLPPESLAYLPFSLSPELQAYLAGEVHVAVNVRLTVPVGRPVAGPWDLESPVALTVLEAVTFGLQLTSKLADTRELESRWLVRTDAAERPGVLLHEHAHGVVVQELIPAVRTAAVGWSARVDGPGGRCLLRDEFALGGLGRRADGGPWRFPRVPVTKAGVQAPDSTVGGWETAQLLVAVATGSSVAGADLDSAREFVGRSLTLLEP